MIPFLADSEFAQLNAAFLKDAIMYSIGLVGLALMVLKLVQSLKGKERTPPLDADLSTIDGRLKLNEMRLINHIDGTNQRLKHIEDSLKEGTKLHMEFATQQGKNATKLEDLFSAVNDLGSRVNDLPKQVVDLLRTKKS